MSTQAAALSDAAHAQVQNARALLETMPKPDDYTIEVLAKTLWGEARGAGQEGMSLVANVIQNRTAHPRWWGSSIVSVCLDPYQFSCWLAGDPNLPKMKAVTAADPDYAAALAIARRAVAGQISDMSGNADSYYDTSIPPPSWTHGREPVRVYQDFRFFRIEI